MSSVTAIELKPLAPNPVPAASFVVNKPRIWTPFAVLAAALIAAVLFSLLAQVLFGLVTGIIMGIQGADAAAIQSTITQILGQPIPALLFALLPTQAGMIAIPLLAARWSKEPMKQRLGLTPQSGRKLGFFKTASLAAFTIGTALTAGIVAMLFLGEPGNNVLSNAMSVHSLWQLTLVSIVISAIPALVEETLFRGYIQRRLLQRWSPAAAITVSSLLFAAMHVDSLQHIIAVIPVGFLVGLLAYRTNSIRPGMLVHALHNTGCVAISAVSGLLLPSVSEDVAAFAMLGMIGGLVLIGLPAVISLVRRDKPVVEKQPEPLRTLSNFGSDSHLVGSAA